MRSPIFKTLLGLIVVAACASDSRVSPNTPALAGITVSLGSASLQVGDTTRATAILFDEGGHSLAAGAGSVAWSSSNTSVATISPTGIVGAVSPGTATLVAGLQGVFGSTSVTVASVPVVTPPTLAIRRVAVSVNAPRLALGASTQASAVAMDSTGAPLAGRPMTWSSSNSSVADVSPAGVVTGMGVGIATISAMSDGVSGAAPVTVEIPRPSVAAIDLTVGSLSLLVGSQTQASAVARDSVNNALSDRPITWSSSNSAIVDVSSTGRLLGVANGTAVVTATSEGKTASATINVFGTPIASMRLIMTAQVYVGQSLATTVMLYDKDQHVIFGRTVEYGASPASVATVSSDGTVTGVGVGNGIVWAASEGKADTASVIVVAAPATLPPPGSSPAPPPPPPSGGGGGGGGSPPPPASPVVTSVSVTADSSTIRAGHTALARATVLDQSNNIMTGQAVVWSSSAPSVASISSSGAYTAVAAGSATLRATIGSVSGTTSITVTAATVAVSTVSVSVANSIAKGSTTQASATTRDASGNVLTGRTIAWSSSNSAVASVSSSGVVTGVAAGTATITATSEGKTGSQAMTVTVTQVPVATVGVSVSSGSITTNQTLQATATTRDASGAVLTGRTVTWSSSNSSVAAVSATGLITGVGVGTASVNATSEGQVGTAPLTVTLAPVATVNVVVAPSTVQLSQTATATATTQDVTGATLTGRTISWSSSNASVATVSSAGLVTGVAAGSTNIVATSEGKSGSAQLTVTSGTVASPFLTEDFSTYTSTSNLHADPRNIYGAEEMGGPWGQWNLITLDQTTGVADIGAGTSHQSMKYTWPDRTNATGVQPDANRCSDFYIVKSLQLPANLTEVWAEFYVKFSTNFTTKAPASWACASNPDYKFIFLTTPSNRFSLKNDYAGVGNRWDPTAPGQGDGDNNFVYNNFHDNAWHRIRIHSKVATSGSNGAHEIWLDGTKVYSNTNISTASQTSINGINLGNNMNQGPDHVMSVNWGQIKVWSSYPGW